MNGPLDHTQLADQWPAQDLEVLGACPCCGSPARRTDMEGLRDFATGAAPGVWTMWRCNGCNCAYLDPRPSAASMERAYAGYHTRKPPLSRLQSAAARLKFVLKGLGSPRAASFQHRIRHLPKGAKRSRVLDVGFGAADFLRVARWLGHEPVGIDFDPETVKSARAEGFEVYQAGLPGSGLADGAFGHVTMSNVLEHLPRPLEALREAFRLLEPGGRLWLSQPNLAAQGVGSRQAPGPCSRRTRMKAIFATAPQNTRATPNRSRRICPTDHLLSECVKS